MQSFPSNLYTHFSVGAFIFSENNRQYQLEKIPAPKILCDLDIAFILCADSQEKNIYFKVRLMNNQLTTREKFYG
jgi:hypothetical protein